MTTWDIPSADKRIVLTLSIDYKHPVWPSDAVIEEGLWTFLISDVIKSQINIEIDVE